MPAALAAGLALNVRVHPDGFLEGDGEHLRVRFEETEGPGRGALCAPRTASWASIATYEERAGRYIPVFRVRILASVPAVVVPETAA